jgi:hypothetical protein
VCIWSDVFITGGGMHYKSCSKKPSETISEPAVLLYVPYGKNFQHILQDAALQLALVRMQLTEREAKGRSVLMYVDGEGGVDSWAHHIVVEMLGFKKIIPLRDDVSFCAHDPIIPLHVPDFTYAFYAEPAFQYLHHMAIDKGILRASSSAFESCNFKVLYVSRPDPGQRSNGRNIRKQNEVVAVVRQWSQSLSLLLNISTCLYQFSGDSPLTKRETHALFHEASAIVGVHGGGFGHIVLSSPQAFIFEILCGQNGRSFANLAYGHKNYHSIVLPGYTNPDEPEVEVPTDLLQGFLGRHVHDIVVAYKSSVIFTTKNHM